MVQTHKAIIGASMAAVDFDQLTTRTDLKLSTYGLGRNFMISVDLEWRLCINCPEGPDTMQPDLREIGPSFFFGPPPLWERLKTSVYIRIEDASPIKRAAFHYFMDTAAKVGKDIMEKKTVGIWDRVKYSLGNLIIFGPLKNMLGMSNVRIAYTAGEAISSEHSIFIDHLV